MRTASYFALPMSDEEYEVVKKKALALLDLFHHNKYAMVRMQTHFHCLDRDDE